MATNVAYPLPSAQAQAIADLTGYDDQDTLRWQQACVQSANNLTALPNGRYVSVRMERIRQGLELSQRGAVSLPDDGQDLSATVRSGNNLYQVDTRLLSCTCADYQKHLQACKHLLAVEVHLGALGLVPPMPAPAAAADMTAVDEVVTPAPVPDPAPTMPVPTTATWPTSEAPASFNIKLRGRDYELMYTVRDVSDQAIVDRIPTFPQWVQKLLIAVAADMKKAAEPAGPTVQAPAPERPLDEEIAAAVAAAMKAQAAASTNGHSQAATPEEHARLTAAQHENDPSWCHKHQIQMRWHDGNSRGPGWFSHQLADGSYCKGK